MAYKVQNDKLEVTMYILIHLLYHEVKLLKFQKLKHNFDLNKNSSHGTNLQMISLHVNGIFTRFSHIQTLKGTRLVRHTGNHGVGCSSRKICLKYLQLSFGISTLM